jgi:hypothetical protein
MKVFIDLFAGLGGASEGFYRDSTWQVMRIDNNEALLEHTAGLIVADITDFQGTMAIINNLMPANVDKLVVWASPPCLEFSNAYSAPASIAARNGEEFNPSLNCLHAAMDIIDQLPCDYWYIENVKGAIEIFDEEIGQAWRQRVGQFFLWGNFPKIALADSTIRGLRKEDKRWSPIRSNIKAKVPIEYSQAILASIDNQLTLTSFFEDAEQDA